MDWINFDDVCCSHTKTKKRRRKEAWTYVENGLHPRLKFFHRLCKYKKLFFGAGDFETCLNFPVRFHELSRLEFNLQVMSNSEHRSWLDGLFLQKQKIPH